MRPSTINARWVHSRYINVLPYPIHVIAPGMMIVDDGAGATIAPLDEAGPLGEFTAAILSTRLPTDMRKNMVLH